MAVVTSGAALVVAGSYDEQVRKLHNFIAKLRVAINVHRVVLRAQHKWAYDAENRQLHMYEPDVVMVDL